MGSTTLPNRLSSTASPEEGNTATTLKTNKNQTKKETKERGNRKKRTTSEKGDGDRIPNAVAHLLLADVAPSQLARPKNPSDANLWLFFVVSFFVACSDDVLSRVSYVPLSLVAGSSFIGRLASFRHVGFAFVPVFSGLAPLYLVFLFSFRLQFISIDNAVSSLMFCPSFPGVVYAPCFYRIVQN